MRFDYGRSLPWVTHDDGHMHATVGPDAMVLTTPAPSEGPGRNRLRLVVRRATEVPFVPRGSRRTNTHTTGELSAGPRTEA